MYALDQAVLKQCLLSPLATLPENLLKRVSHDNFSAIIYFLRSVDPVPMITDPDPDPDQPLFILLAALSEINFGITLV